jgi:hypothetical protein
LATAFASDVGTGFRSFFAAGACLDFAATGFCGRESAAGPFLGLAVRARAGLSVAKVRRVFFDMIVV